MLNAEVFGDLYLNSDGNVDEDITKILREVMGRKIYNTEQMERIREKKDTKDYESFLKYEFIGQPSDDIDDEQQRSSDSASESESDDELNSDDDDNDFEPRSPRSDDEQNADEDEDEEHGNNNDDNKNHGAKRKAQESSESDGDVPMQPPLKKFKIPNNNISTFFKQSPKMPVPTTGDAKHSNLRLLQSIKPK